MTSNTRNKVVKFSFLDGGHLCQKLFFQLLENDFECVLDDDFPDIIVYSLYGNEHLRHSCKKICVDGENSFPDFNECDYAISPHYLSLGQRHCRIPFYVFNKEYQILTNSQRFMHDNPLSRQFCSAVISNNLNADPQREALFRKIHDKKQICSVGKCFNTAGFTLQQRPEFAENLDTKFTNPQKIAFMSQFKFGLALENSRVDGYCTEKITDAFAAGCVPIYWGDPRVHDEFNENSFIDVSRFHSIDEAVEYIIEVDKNDDLYMSMLQQSHIVKNCSYLDQLKAFLINAIEGPSFEHSYGNIAVQLNRLK